MPALQWPRAPIEIVQAFEARREGRSNTGALILWSTWTVEGLYYLDELSKMYEAESTSGIEHQPESVNIAHVRWATGSAVTALDLCAPALGCEFCQVTGDHELDLRCFDPSSRKCRQELRELVSSTSAEWIDGVLADERYQVALAARHPLTHSRLKRRLLGDPADTEFVIGAPAKAWKTRDLVTVARELATEQVTAFLAVTESIP
jgi:hypothetical protein